LVENFGCRTSQADGDAIAAQMDGFGAQAARDTTDADVIVLNTCAVTSEAERSARAYIRRARRMNPNSRIVVTGCYAQRDPQEIAAMPGVNAVIGNSHKDHVASIAMEGLANRKPDSFVPLAALEASLSEHDSHPFLLSGDIFAHSDFQFPPVPASEAARQNARRTRPTLKIQDGCGNRCTFCIIPSLRGNSRSMPAQHVVDEVHAFVEAGGKELVLSGINLGRWGRDLTPPDRFESLLADILETTLLPRIRISSVEPMDWTDGLISLLARWSTGDHPRLARHVHMPLQSGSDAVLRRMHRRYRPWHYAERIAKIPATVPLAAIGADVMVGFPGETEAEFQESYDFIAAQPFTYLHLFPFSARPGTPAWEFHRQSPVPSAAVRERMTALRDLIDRKNVAFRSNFMGKILSAVTLIPKASSPDSNLPRHSMALTDNFLPVELDRMYESNLLLPVQITGTTPHGLTGAVLRQPNRIA